jgi:hypothetical protein
MRQRQCALVFGKVRDFGCHEAANSQEATEGRLRSDSAGLNGAQVKSPENQRKAGLLDLLILRHRRVAAAPCGAAAP